MLDVSIIIVNYNTLKMTDECICSVIEKTLGISYEIILVDNASTDGSKEFFSNDSRVKYIYNVENLGFGRANNKGIEIAQGRNILFLNSDTLLRNNAIKILFDFLDSHPKVGACGGNLYNQYGKPTHSFYRRLPSVLDELNDFLANHLYQLMYGSNWEFNYTDKPLKVGHITGANLMVRQEKLKSIGGYDARFFMYYEDTELCHRISQTGQTIISCPEAEIMHYTKDTISQTTKNYVNESRLLYFSITHSKLYCSSLHFSRVFLSILKMLSPNAHTRNRWKGRMHYYRPIVN